MYFMPNKPTSVLETSFIAVCKDSYVVYSVDFDWVGKNDNDSQNQSVSMQNQWEITINTLIFIYLCCFGLGTIEEVRPYFFMWFSMILHWFSMILNWFLTDSQWFLLILADSQNKFENWFSMIFWISLKLISCWFSLILTNSQWFLGDSHQFSMILCQFFMILK